MVAVLSSFIHFNDLSGMLWPIEPLGN